MVLNLETNNVGIAILGAGTEIKEGSTVKRTDAIVEVPVGAALLVRVVNAIGEPIVTPSITPLRRITRSLSIFMRGPAP